MLRKMRVLTLTIVTFLNVWVYRLVKNFIFAEKLSIITLPDSGHFRLSNIEHILESSDFMPTLLLIRHAHRLDFIQPEWFNTAIYPYDPPLSALGWQQALELVPKLLHLPIIYGASGTIDRLFASPYLRTLQTAYPIASGINRVRQGLGLKICIENGLREWLHPDWSPTLPETLPLAEKILQVPLIDLKYSGILEPQYPETLAAVNSRSQQVAEKLAGLSDRCVAIVAHKHTLSGMLTALLPANSTIPEFLPAMALVLTSDDRTMGSWQITEIL
jgi:broad specificity phosphatase PhoE